MYTDSIMFIVSTKLLPVYFFITALCVFSISAITVSAKTASGTPAVATTSTTTVTAAPQTPTVGAHTLTPLQQKRVINLSANISNKLDATSIRLTNILLRMASRVRIMEQEGKDVAVLKTQLDNATKELEATKATLHHIDADVAKVTSSEKPQQEWLVLRKTFTDTNINLQQIKRSLQEVLTAMKVAVPIATVPPQSTTTKTAQ